MEAKEIGFHTCEILVEFKKAYQLSLCDHKEISSFSMPWKSAFRNNKPSYLFMKEKWLQIYVPKPILEIEDFNSMLFSLKDRPL